MPFDLSIFRLFDAQVGIFKYFCYLGFGHCKMWIFNVTCFVIDF